MARVIRQRQPSMPLILTFGYSHVLAEGGCHGFELLLKSYPVDHLSLVLRNAARVGESGC
jgi:hypothetical protein